MTREITEQSLISIVAPVYNEREVLDSLCEALKDQFKSMKWDLRYEIVFVNDGSADGSGQKLDQLAQANENLIKVVHLSRNFGHAAAVSAGLEHACGDAVILMDSDMQDDPSAFSSFIEKWLDGFDVVYAVRVSRKDGLFSKAAFFCFYRILSLIADTPLPSDAGNFALMDRRVVEEVSMMQERNRYHAGLRAWVGHKQIGVPVPRLKRYLPQGRVGLRGQWKLAMNAVFSFSYVPLFLFRFIGVLAMGLSAFLVCFTLYHKLFTGRDVTTWFSLLFSISFFGGINLFGIGVLGEYIARIYDEIRERPPFIVESVTDCRNDDGT